MNRTTILAVGAGLLVLITGIPAAAAATPADAPDAAGDNHATDERSVGPSGGLPGPVPDFVSEIHSTITGFLNGEIDSLGESLSGLLSDRGPADAANSTGA
jgi:hypothetical protein